MLIEFGDAYLNPQSISHVQVLEGSLAGVTEVVITMNSGDRFRDIVDTPQDAQEFLGWLGEQIDMIGDFDDADDDLFED